MRLARTVADIMSRFADRPALGERPKRPVYDAALTRTVLQPEEVYSTITYRELWSRVNAVAAEFTQNPHHALRPGNKVAFLAFTSSNYTILDLACIRLGLVSIPLQTTLAEPDLAAILAETEPDMLAVSPEYLDIATKHALNTSSVRRIVVFDCHTQIDDHRETLGTVHKILTHTETGTDRICITLLEDIITTGAILPEAAWPPEETEHSPLCMLIYTSGSTGSPKGAMYTEALAARLWTDLPDERPISLHYMPLSHVLGQSYLKVTLARGGTCCFTVHSNLSSLLDDMALVRPTELSLVPRVCEMLYQYFHRERAKQLSNNTDISHHETMILHDMRTRLLGGRITFASCGSAPLSHDLEIFMEKLLTIPLHNIYGATEVDRIWFDNKLLRPPITDYTLIDVPELNYYRTDKPHPRGELLLKTKALIPGYYKRPELSKSLRDAEGFYHTGDIVAQTGEDTFLYIERRKNVIKLAQGEFITIAHLEAQFAASALVHQIFIHARSTWSNLLAVVVPTSHALEAFDGRQSDLIRQITESFREIAKQNALRPYEIPRAFILETEPFSQTNGLLSELGKPMWPKLRERYADALDTLYEQSTSQQTLYQNLHNRSTITIITDAVRNIVGNNAITIKPEDQFRDLGGDSLSAIQLSTFLEDIFHTRVPLDMIISRGTDLQDLANHIDTYKHTSSERPSVASIHGDNAKQFYAHQLSLERFITPSVINNAATLLPPVSPPRTILLTGASGFLGRFLGLNLWHTHLEKNGGKLICLVRGKNDEAAYHRLAEAFRNHDHRLKREFQHLSANTLEVIAGDLALPHFGLDDETWNRLARTVDTIVHAGAMVNHTLSYTQLFDANVSGTAELIALALTHHLKALTFISTVAVTTLPENGPPVDEDSDIRSSLPSLTPRNTHADGYATSKWASEVLLREAHEHFHLPVTVFRPSMLLAHREFSGQINSADVFTRLLFSLILTRLAPGSFYDTNGISPAEAHYDGLPVDFAANVIARLGIQPQSGYWTYNLVNPHNDGISLDTVVQWLNDFGHKIERISNYTAWLKAFKAALESLPAEQQKNSILPLLPSLLESGPLPVRKGSYIPSGRFYEVIRILGWPTESIPHVDADLVGKYFMFLDVHLVAGAGFEPAAFRL